MFFSLFKKDAKDTKVSLFEQGETKTKYKYMQHILQMNIWYTIDCTDSKNILVDISLGGTKTVNCKIETYEDNMEFFIISHKEVKVGLLCYNPKINRLMIDYSSDKYINMYIIETIREELSKHVVELTYKEDKSLKIEK